MALDRATSAFAEALGQAIVELSYYFCGVPRDAHPSPGGIIAGFDKLAPVYIATTEHRDGPGPEQRKRYSSCGDQLHAIVERLGIREPWVNRASMGQYRPGMNIQCLEPFNAKTNPYGSPASIFAPADPSYRPPVGSLCLIWTSGYDAHAFVCLGYEDPTHMITGNYGAGGMSAATAPGANVAGSNCAWEPARHALLIGGSHRALHCVLTPAALAQHVTAQINLTGAPVGDDVVEALGARYDE